MRRRRTKVDMSDISGEPEAGGSIDPRAITGRRPLRGLLGSGYIG
jgi:hypothetical protein